MIRYDLECEKDHLFESWFQSSEAYEALKAAGHVVCPKCGSADVSKSLMAPQVRPAKAAKASEKAPLSTPASPEETAMAELRKKVETESDYVGMQFAKEARAMHDGDAPLRSIYGEAKPEEAKSLIEDGVPVAPLPFVPKSKTN
jgi:hypothetical protein